MKRDPLLYPPDFIAFVERVRTLRAASISERAAPPRAMPSRGWYLVPFGVGHFVHQRETKGTLYAYGVLDGLVFTPDEGRPLPHTGR